MMFLAISVGPSPGKSAQTGSVSPVTPSLPRHIPDEPLVIPGPQEAAVWEYCKWLEPRATDEGYKAYFRKICHVMLENHLDLEVIFEDPDAGFFVQRGIQIGTARRFLRDISEWARAKLTVPGLILRHYISGIIDKKI
ncbi:unnamed protein product [Penicillium pancosmium]